MGAKITVSGQSAPLDLFSWDPRKSL